MRLVPVAVALMLLPAVPAAYPKCTGWSRKVVGVSRDGRYVATTLEHSHGGIDIAVSDASVEGAVVLGGELPLDADEFLERPLEFGKLVLVRVADWPARNAAKGKGMAAAIRSRCGEATAKSAAEPRAFVDGERPATPLRALFGTSYVVLVYRPTGEDGCDDSISGEEARALPCGSSAETDAQLDREVLGAGDRAAVLAAIVARAWRGKKDPALALSLLSRTGKDATVAESLVRFSDATLYLSHLGEYGARNCLRLGLAARVDRTPFEGDPRIRDAILHNLKRCKAILAEKGIEWR